VKKGNSKSVWILVAVIGGGLISIAVAYELLFKSKTATGKLSGATKANPYGSGGSKSTANSGGSSYAPSYASGYPLKIGSSGSNVKALQQALNDLGATLAVDGQFGALTQQALLAQTGSATVDSPSALQALVGQGNTMSTTPNYQGSMLAANAPVCADQQFLNSLTPTPSAPPACTNYFVNNF